MKLITTTHLTSVFHLVLLLQSAIIFNNISSSSSSLDDNLSKSRAPAFSNISVVGSVFCDVCSNNTFSKHIYFLRGAKLQLLCKFKPDSSSTEEITISAEKTTNSFGFYKLDIPWIHGVKCREGVEIQSFCSAILKSSSSPSCNIPGLKTSTAHIAIKPKNSNNTCFFNLNSLNYRPAKPDFQICRPKTRKAEMNKGEEEEEEGALNSSLFFFLWPPPSSLPFGLPWPLSSLPFPFIFPPSSSSSSSSSSWPFELPPWFPKFPPFFSQSPDKPSFFPFPFSQFLPPISSFFPPAIDSPPSSPPSSSDGSWFSYLFPPLSSLFPPSPSENSTGGSWFPFFSPSPPSQQEQSKNP